MLKVSLCVAIFLLAACSPPNLGRPSSGAVNLSLESERMYSPLPEGMALHIQYHVRSDRYYVSKVSGAFRRRVELEVRGLSAARTVEEIERALLLVGYKASGEPRGGKNITKMTFKRKNSANIAVELASSIGNAPADPRADHLVTFRWTVSESLESWLSAEGQERS